MDGSDFKRHINDKALHVANHLNTLTPYQRSLVMHQAEAMWQEREEKRRGVPFSPEEEFEEAELDQRCWLLVEVFRNLSPESRDAVQKMAQEVLQLERLNSLFEEES